jgi:hypothetical protein
VDPGLCRNGKSLPVGPPVGPSVEFPENREIFANYQGMRIGHRRAYMFVLCSRQGAIRSR